MKWPSMEDLKPCPFCGTEDPWVEQKGTSYWVECNLIKCCARGPPTTSSRMAMYLWNRRV